MDGLVWKDLSTLNADYWIPYSPFRAHDCPIPNKVYTHDGKMPPSSGIEAGSELTSRPGHPSVLDRHLNHIRGSRSTPCCQAVSHCTNDVDIADTQAMYAVRSRGRPGSRISGLRVAGEWNIFRYWLLEFVLQVVLYKFWDPLLRVGWDSCYDISINVAIKALFR